MWGCFVFLLPYILMVFSFFSLWKNMYAKKDVSLSKKASTKKAPLLKSIMGWLDYKEK